MAESKPTKLQMAKEIEHLIAAAQDMSAVMDLNPVIKTDYLIDLKNKTVTATHLQNVVANLQADIKRDASMIEPEDKFQPGTHEVLANLNIKVPRPTAKEKVVEDDDDVIPTPSPPITEDVKPVKKEKKTKSTNKITKKSIIIGLLDKDEGATLEQMANACTGAGLGDYDVNLKTAKLWIRKIGFPVKKDDDGVYTKG